MKAILLNWLTLPNSLNGLSDVTRKSFLPLKWKLPLNKSQQDQECALGKKYGQFGFYVDFNITTSLQSAHLDNDASIIFPCHKIWNVFLKYMCKVQPNYVVVSKMHMVWGKKKNYKPYKSSKVQWHSKGSGWTRAIILNVLIMKNWRGLKQ